MWELLSINLVLISSTSLYFLKLTDLIVNFITCCFHIILQPLLLQRNSLCSSLLGCLILFFSFFFSSFEASHGIVAALLEPSQSSVSDLQTTRHVRHRLRRRFGALWSDFPPSGFSKIISLFIIKTSSMDACPWGKGQKCEKWIEWKSVNTRNCHYPSWTRSKEP